MLHRTNDILGHCRFQSRDFGPFLLRRNMNMRHRNKIKDLRGETPKP
jgi:hypothetical protein